MLAIDMMEVCIQYIYIYIYIYILNSVSSAIITSEIALIS